MSGTNSTMEPVHAKMSPHEPGEQTLMSMAANGRAPKILLSRTTPNQNVRNALRSLAEHDMLAEFWTTIAWNPQSPWNKLIPRSLQTQLARRSIPEAPAQQVRTVCWRELVRLGARGTAAEDLLCSSERPFSVYGMGKHFDRRVAQRLRELRPDIAYGYDGACLETFREARKLGITTVYEHTCNYSKWDQELFLEEAQHNPEYANLFPILMEPERELERKKEELSLADYVVVPSQHVCKTMRGVISNDRIRVVRYGAPAVYGSKEASLDPSRPLKVLFAGQLTQRKGIGYLVEAVEILGERVELTLVGMRFRANERVDKACMRSRWYETLPHPQLIKLMQESDVFVMPSLSDAFGLVVTEALACGLPVIVTPNAGVSEIVVDGREGFVVPICRSDAIAERLETLCRDRQLLAQMSQRAQLTARDNSWEHYRENLASTVRSLQWQ